MQKIMALPALLDPPPASFTYRTITVEIGRQGLLQRTSSTSDPSDSAFINPSKERYPTTAGLSNYFLFFPPIA
jgi:hypothetical protein